jgi:hypothetical protein
VSVRVVDDSCACASAASLVVAIVRLFAAFIATIESRWLMLFDRAT